MIAAYFQLFGASIWYITFHGTPLLLAGSRFGQRVFLCFLGNGPLGVVSWRNPRSNREGRDVYPLKNGGKGRQEAFPIGFW